MKGICPRSHIKFDYNTVTVILLLLCIHAAHWLTGDPQSSTPISSVKISRSSGKKATWSDQQRKREEKPGIHWVTHSSSTCVLLTQIQGWLSQSHTLPSMEWVWGQAISQKMKILSQFRKREVLTFRWRTSDKTMKKDKWKSILISDRMAIKGLSVMVTFGPWLMCRKWCETLREGSCKQGEWQVEWPGEGHELKV